MIAKILITFCVFIIVVLIPILEINPSHVFNETWPAHARFHHVWQLITNFLIGLLCLYLVWLKGEIPLASILVIMVMGSVLIAYVSQGYYAGSILSGNISKTILGVNLTAIVASATVSIAVVAAIIHSRSKK